MIKNSAKDICDLRTALKYLENFPEELHVTNQEVDPVAELAGVYRYIGAGGTVERPTKTGPAMIFNNVKGYPGKKIVIGLLANRRRVGRLLGTEPEKLGFLLKDCLNHPISPVIVGKEKAKCQNTVYRAEENGFDIRKIVPASTNTPEDAGPYITMGMCYATHPDTGVSDMTIHRLCFQDEDTLSVYFTPGARHIGAMFEAAEKKNQVLPVSVSIGVDPAIEMATCFEAPATPLGYNELGIAGALRNRPVELVKCLTINEYAVANAEYVIEGELIPGKRIAEDSATHTGHSMPEFPGYNGPACPECAVLKVRAVTHRENPIMQTCIGPSEEHVSLAGIPTEASILELMERALPGKVQNVYAHSSGGGKYMAVIQFKKQQPSDEGRQRQAALVAFTAFPELKNIILVDEDVDLFDSNDVLWALNTRFQGDEDIITIPGVRCHPLDPSETPEYSSRLRDRGMTCKTVFDCTVPWNLKEKFKRAKFLETDYGKFL